MYTMIGRPGGKVVVPMVKRKSLYTLIGLAEDALEISGKLFEELGIHRGKVETMTFDNGKEFAGGVRIFV